MNYFKGWMLFLFPILFLWGGIYKTWDRCFADDRQVAYENQWGLGSIVVNAIKGFFLSDKQWEALSKEPQKSPWGSINWELQTNDQKIAIQLSNTLKNHRHTQERIGEWVKKLDKHKLSTKRTQKIYLEMSKQLDELEILLIDRPTTKQETKKHIINIQKMIKQLQVSIKESSKELHP